MLRPLDKLRQLILSSCIDWLRPFIRSREKRVALLAIVLMSIALCGAMFVPLWILALGPIIWGVPHIVGDVRYLVIRSGYIQRRILWLAVGVPLLLVTCTIGVPWLTQTFHAAVVFGFLGSLGALWCAHTTHTKRAIGTVVLVGLIAASYHFGYYADIVFAHAHNFIAVALWWFWRKREGDLHWYPLAFFLLIAASLMMGMADPALQLSGGLHWAPTKGHMNYHLSSLAPGIPPLWGIRLVILFTFAQSVHYIIWVRMIPEEDRPQHTPRTFAASYRALKDDFGAWALLATSLFALFVIGWALFDLMEARIGYLRIALFHGHLELAVATLFWAESRKPKTRE